MYASTVKKYQQLIETEIRRQQFGVSPSSLYEPIRYLMNLGGKRLRPLLVVMGYALFKKEIKPVVPFAVAVEVFHNFTLMHDDIMDNAPLRRGYATVHEKWNVNTAILSGDVMLVRVYDMFLKLPPRKLKQVLEVFNRCATQVCEGQQWDMEYQVVPHVTEKQYLDMIRQKTAVLLGFSLELGGILAGTTAAHRNALREFGINIGMGFQLMDDLLDAYGNPEKFGKLVGGDIIANKKTFLLLRSLATASDEQRKVLHHWLTAADFNPAEKVAEIKKIWDQLGIRQQTEKKIKSFFSKGYRSLEGIKGEKAAKERLRSFTEELVWRQY